MNKVFMTLVGLAFALAAVPSHAEDICFRRPDLCDDAAPAPKRPAPRPAVRAVPAAPTPAPTPIAKSCREPGASYSLDEASLPFCATKLPAKAPTPRPAPVARVATPTPMPVPTPPPFTTQSARQPAGAMRRVAPANLNFDSYFQANARNPALASRRRLPQEAFKDYSKPAVISGSSPDLNPDGTTTPPPAANAGAASGALPAAGTTGTPISLPAGFTVPAGYTIPAGLLPPGTTLPAATGTTSGGSGADPAPK